MSRRRWHTKAFKLSAIARLETASDVRALALELGVDRGLLYKWSRSFQIDGEAGLRFPGERLGPTGLEEALASRSGDRGSASATPSGASGVAALERKVAQQALELNFFRAALQHFAARRRETGGSGGTGSTP